ncbi:hypothetical protein GIB67_035913 [Kingdonia uniflora]|uniref:Short-chain dehydrogenase/reductase n=1 Tax=Kingdonia uniflora TaxID=39325 RepID=A0A7J7NXN7_9MAGN|nr:hypothetical protein GIB67_035913 [Kingdonia uniflora]
MDENQRKPENQSCLRFKLACDSSSRCAVVTGGNKGIGFKICRKLASNGIIVILASRDEKRGVEAAENLKESGLTDVVFHQLDVMDPASIASLAHFIKTKFGKLDILVNNAGISGIIRDTEPSRALKSESSKDEDENAKTLEGIMVQSYERAEECLKTNYYGTKGVTEVLLPFLQLSNSARIVNVSSRYGSLTYISNKMVKAQLTNADSLTEEQLDDVFKCYLKDFKKDKLESNGWPITASAYTVSKVLVNAYTRILARKFPKFRINCVHPGYVKTDINRNMGVLTPEEGTRGPVMLALLPDDAPSGSYFHQMEISSFN